MASTVAEKGYASSVWRFRTHADRSGESAVIANGGGHEQCYYIHVHTRIHIRIDIDKDIDMDKDIDIDVDSDFDIDIHLDMHIHMP